MGIQNSLLLDVGGGNSLGGEPTSAGGRTHVEKPTFEGRGRPEGGGVEGGGKGDDPFGRRRREDGEVEFGRVEEAVAVVEVEAEEGGWVMAAEGGEGRSRHGTTKECVAL